jgi:hypothetical protein
MVLPDSAFGLPSEREYPMPDYNHAVVAKMDARLAYDNDMLTKSELSRIDKKADTIIDRHIMREAERRGLVKANPKGRTKNPSAAEHKKAGGDALSKADHYWDEYRDHGRAKDLADAMDWATRAHVEMKYARDPKGLRDAKAVYEEVKAELIRVLEYAPHL